MQFLKHFANENGNLIKEINNVASDKKLVHFTGDLGFEKELNEKLVPKTATMKVLRSLKCRNKSLECHFQHKRRFLE